jgi:Helix-turn-helix domain
MSDLKQRGALRKPATFTGNKCDMNNAVCFDHERIDPFTFRVFHALAFCLNQDDGLCCPSDDYLVMLAGQCQKTVQRARNKLRQCGYLDWRRRRGPDGKTHNYYTFYHTAAAPVLASVRRKRERRKERRQMLQREAREALSNKPFKTAPF